jgi:hypothetical protein
MSKVRRQIRKANRDLKRSQAANQLRRRRFAVVLFILVLTFCAGEIFAIFTAKNQHDYRRAREDADELSIELGLISSALHSGNKTLYENALLRYRASLISFTDNDYVRKHRLETLARLRDYSDALKDNESNIIELLEFAAAIDGLRSELDDIDTEKLDAANFYHIQQSFQTLRDALSKLKAEEYSKLRDRIDSFAGKISELAKNSAVCVSVCPKSSFSDKQKQLESYRDKYEKEFKELGLKVSKRYDPSTLIVELSEI